MTTRYLVPSLSSDAPNYDPTTGLPTGGDGSTPGYTLLSTLCIAINNDDSIRLEDGEIIEVVACSLSETNIDIKPVAGANCIINFTNPASGGLNFTAPATGTYIDDTGGSISILFPVANANKAALTLNHGTQYSRGCIFDSGENLIRTASTTEVVNAYNPVFKQSVRDPNARTFAGPGTGNVSGKLILHNPVFDGIGVLNVNTSVNLEIFNPLFLNVKGEAIEIADSGFTAGGGAIKVYNPVAIGCTVDFSTKKSLNFTEVAAGVAAEINGGIWHESVFGGASNPLTETGTFTADKGDGGVVKLANGAQKAYVSLGIWDSKVFSLTPLLMSQYTDIAIAKDVGLTMYPDDIVAFEDNTNAIAGTTAFLAHNKNEFAIAGNSGSDDLSIEKPFIITYSGTGTGTLTISDNGELWTFEGSTTTFTADASSGGDEQYMYPAGTGMFDLIDASVDWSITKTAAENYDDFYSRNLADAVYSFPDATPISIDVDFDRLVQNEYVAFKNSIMNKYGYEVTTAYHQSFKTSTGFEDAVNNSNAFTAFVNLSIVTGENINYKQQVSTMNPMNLHQVEQGSAVTMLTGTLATWQGLATDAERIAITQPACNRLATYLLNHGGYLPICFAQYDAGTPTPDELGIIINCMINAGIEIITPKDAVKIVGSNAPKGGNDYSHTSDSAGLETGVKYWTGANPIGIDGEPFSDIKPDCGPVQSTHSKFHPKNL